MIHALRASLVAAADPDQAAPMAAYMKGLFPFLGVPSPRRKLAQKPNLDALKHQPIEAILHTVDACWEQHEREFQYVGADLLRRYAKRLQPEHLATLRRYITTHSWWDTVDVLAAHAVGPLVRSHTELVNDMDQWITDPNIWVARTALLHQLTYKEATDGERLFRYVTLRMHEPEFFLRKACGWALREYARQQPQAVRAFVAAHEASLSGLTKREALKHL
jgi:3-methyladenine DNA glycosylase AlkD